VVTQGSLSVTKEGHQIAPDAPREGSQVIFNGSQLYVWLVLLLRRMIVEGSGENRFG